MDKIFVRIINKSKQGALVRTMDGRREELISWKDFEENFIATEDKFIYELKITPEMEQEAAKMYERMTWLAKQAFHIFRITNPNPPTPLTIQDLALLDIMPPPAFRLPM